ncbi:hypothetical protein AKJ16_DCAP00832 [Drosera capensis]
MVEEEGRRVAGEEMKGLSKDLQAALCTAKWQLEEFERAVRMGCGNCRDENRIARYQSNCEVCKEYVKPVVSSQSEIMPRKGNWDQGTSVTHVSDDIRINVDGDCTVELISRKEPRTTEDLDEGRVTNIWRTWTSPNFNSLRAIVPEADDEMTPLTPKVQDSSKEKGSRLFVRGQNQLFRWFYGLQSTLQKPRLLHVNHSVQLMFVFRRTLFLFGEYGQA